MGSTKVIIITLAALFSAIMHGVVVAETSCEFRQDLVMGQEYYIYNLQYPGNYPASTYCMWYGYSQAGTKIVVACDDIALPNTKDCTGDKLAISLSGDINLRDSKNYCGTGSVSLVTDGNSLAVGLFATTASPGGRFICSLTAIQDPDVSTTQTPSTCDCGWKRELRIVGGNETLINEFPSMAGLVDAAVGDVVCGGNIISTRYVLTAAHCLLNVQLANLGILVGDHNISAGFDTVSAALYKVLDYEAHPNFDSNTMVNDIAILRTALEMSFSFSVGPICLPFRYTTWDFYGQTVTALGWGQLFFTGPKSDVLQKVDLSVTSNELCAQENSGSTITTGQICTYSPGKDACQSDSGGPLLWMDTSRRRLHLVGLISYGLGCATARPGINTRITTYISWIVSRTSDASYCMR